MCKVEGERIEKGNIKFVDTNNSGRVPENDIGENAIQRDEQLFGQSDTLSKLKQRKQGRQKVELIGCHNGKQNRSRSNCRNIREQPNEFEKNIRRYRTRMKQIKVRK